MLFKSRIRLSSLLLSSLGWFIISCGYVPLANPDANAGRTWTIPIVENRTAQTGLSGPLTDALRQQAAMRGLTIVSENTHAVRLEVVILSVSVAPGALTAERGALAPLDSIWRIDAEARLEGGLGRVEDGPHAFHVHGRSYRGGGMLEEDTLAERRRSVLIEDLAANIVEFFLRKE